MFTDAERQYVDDARVGRLATADAEGRPNVVPVCFALDDTRVVIAVDEKPQASTPDDMRRIEDVRTNPQVALVVDHYSERWSELGWVQIRGTAAVLDPEGFGHGSAVVKLRETYEQYEDHALEERPVLEISPGSVLSWGRLERPAGD